MCNKLTVEFCCLWKGCFKDTRFATTHSHICMFRENKQASVYDNMIINCDESQICCRLLQIPCCQHTHKWTLKRKETDCNVTVSLHVHLRQQVFLRASSSLRVPAVSLTQAASSWRQVVSHQTTCAIAVWLKFGCHSYLQLVTNKSKCNRQVTIKFSYCKDIAILIVLCVTEP